MQSKKQIPIALTLVLASGGAFAAIGDGKAVVLEKPAQVHQTAAKVSEPTQPQPEAKAASPAPSVREAGANVCEEAMSAAALMSETFMQFSNEILPKVLQTGEEFARQMEPTVRQLEPTMREFAERLQEVARQMEQSFRERPTR